MGTLQRPESAEFPRDLTPEYDEVLPLLDTMCKSPGFRRSARLQRFLRYVTEQTLRRPPQPLKEYQIGLAVFDKDASFDPQQDPIVRVEASRLRLRLTEYYAGPGLTDEIVIELPKGSYVPVFRTNLPAGQSQGPILVSSKSRAGDRQRGPEVRSIAVLPFVNADADPATEYLSEGITETLTNRLAQISTFRVAPRTQVTLHRHADRDLVQTARALNVEFLLTGRVLVRGDGRLRVQAELIDATRNAQIWGESYTRPFSSLLDVEDQVAREILIQLRPKFAEAEVRRVTAHETDSVTAYEHCLKGRYHWNKRTPEGMTLALKHFFEALDEDPRYARAHSGVADSYTALASFGVLAPRDAFPLAKTAAMRAIEIDASAAEAYTSLATVNACYDWDWPSAERRFQHAIDLDPNYATGYHWFGCCLCGFGKLDEGLALLKRAQQLDPLSLIIQTQIGTAYYLAREFGQAENACRSALAIDARFWTAHCFLGLGYQQQGCAEQALAELQQAMELSDSNTLAVGSLAHHYGSMGKRRQAAALLKSLQRQRERKYVNAYPIALAFAGLNNWDETLNSLERAYEDRSTSLALWLKGDPRLDPVRANPRFRSLLRRMRMSG